MAKVKKVLLTVPQYANLRGVDQGAVRYAIREGKLSQSVVRDGVGGVKIDPDIAEQEWTPRLNSKELPVEPQKKKQNLRQ